MSTPATPPPDYGEPWQATDHHFITTEGNFSPGVLASLRCKRIAACVNACAGMTDPAAEIAALRRWKAEQLAVEAEWDAQKVGKLLNLPLGAAIMPAIQPAIEAMREAIKEAAQVIENARFVHQAITTYAPQDAVDKIENQKHCDNMTAALAKLAPFLP